MPNSTPLASELDVIQAQLERGQRFFQSEEHRDILDSARDLVHASAACGSDLTLNPRQVKALSYYLELQRSVHIFNRQLSERDLEAALQTATNIVPFSIN